MIIGAADAAGQASVPTPLRPPGPKTPRPPPRDRPVPPRALLFDFDGVIADTENVHVAAWERTFGLMGLEVPPEECARAVEVDDREFLAEIFARKEIAGGDVDGWVRRKQELTAALLADSPRVYPGVAELVAALSGRARLAVVSTTWRENIATVLRSAGLDGAFELFVGKEDVRAVKPDPECYLLALKRLGLAPDEAAALEDSPSGLASARAAGIRVLAIGHRRKKGDWIGDATFLPDLAGTRAVLEALGWAV
jgi:beta-phosphoglucomutase